MNEAREYTGLLVSRTIDEELPAVSHRCWSMTCDVALAVLQAKGYVHKFHPLLERSVLGLGTRVAIEKPEGLPRAASRDPSDEAKRRWTCQGD